jgi:hypothetical protein
MGAPRDAGIADAVPHDYWEAWRSPFSPRRSDSELLTVGTWDNVAPAESRTWTISHLHNDLFEACPMARHETERTLLAQFFDGGVGLES